MTLLEWLEDFIQQIDNPENKQGETDLDRCYIDGCFYTQKEIAKKLKYAVQQEKERILK